MKDDPEEFSSYLRNEYESLKLSELKTFEPNMDMLSTAAKHCKKEICRLLLEKLNFGNYFRLRLYFGKILFYSQIEKIQIFYQMKGLVYDNMLLQN